MGYKISESVTEKNPQFVKQQKQKTVYWHTRDKKTPIPDMDDDFLEKAFFHCLKMLGIHASRVLKSKSETNKWMYLFRHISEEAIKRDLPWIEERQEA